MSYLCSMSLQSMCFKRSMQVSLTQDHLLPLKLRFLVKIFSSTCSLLVPVNGISPQRSSYIITPRLHTSLLKSLGCLRTISGDLYPSVPESYLKHSWSSRMMAKPKSAILTYGFFPLLLRKTFLCLMSLCTICFKWISLIPTANCTNICSAYCSVKNSWPRDYA